MDEENNTGEAAASKKFPPAVEVLAKILFGAAIVFGFCYFPGSLLLQNIDAPGAQSLSNPVTLAAPTNGASGYSSAVNPSATSDVCVNFEFLGLDSTSSNANFSVIVGATQYGVGQINQKIDNGYTNPFLLITSNAGLNTIAIDFPLSALQKDDTSTTCVTGQPPPANQQSSTDQQYSYQTTKSIFVLGQPRAFPQDWYELNDTVAVYLCKTNQPENECLTGFNLTGTVISKKPQVSSLPTTVIATSDDQDLAMTINRGLQQTPQGSQPALKFVLRRSGLFVRYTYAVAAMPFLLIILLSGSYLCKIRKKNKETTYSPGREMPKVHEIAFGVAATLVAILPLRAVLVPSSLPNLTRLDICFGTGAAALVALSVSWVFFWRRTEKPQQSSENAPSKNTASESTTGA